MHRAIVGIHGGFHRIADVVELADAFQTNFGRIGMDIGSHIAIDNPNQAAGIGENQIRIGIPVQEIGHGAQPRGDVAANHHAAVLGEVAGEQDVDILARDRSGGPHQQRGNGKTAFALVVCFDIAIAGWVIEFGLRGIDEDRVLDVFAVIQLGSRELEAGFANDGRRVLDDQLRQSVRRHAIGFGHHDAVAVGVDEVRIDPARSGFAQLREVQFARRQHHLAQLAIDDIAIDIGVGINVGPVRLELRDGVVKSVPIPETHVVQQRLMLFEIDGLVRLGREVHFIRPLVDSEGGTRGLDMLLNIRTLDGDFVGLHVRGADDGWNHVTQYDDAHHGDQRRAPAAHGEQPSRDHAAGDFHPLQGKHDVLIHIIHADHETAVFFEQQAVARQEKSSGHGEQKRGAESPQEIALQRAGQIELGEADALHVAPIADAAHELPTTFGNPIDQRAQDNDRE